ncbi:hypothetical protein HZH68_012365 [Vespula germanica]|uniref:C2H2-type domain-containing protein n=1 Tax=Vespula germanica TaxID=30212 RepID=A0A834JGU4_VESGE|nr:hypothetical protein HZH68_012365 [Vespula germanica]
MNLLSRECNMEDSKEYDALWMLERKARSIGEDQESFLGPMKSISSKMPEQAGPSYPIAQLYGGDSYIAVLQAQYVCTDCGKKYKWQDSLKRHQRVDCGNKEKKFSCNVTVAEPKNRPRNLFVEQVVIGIIEQRSGTFDRISKSCYVTKTSLQCLHWMWEGLQMALQYDSSPNCGVW